MITFSAQEQHKRIERRSRMSSHHVENLNWVVEGRKKIYKRRPVWRKIHLARSASVCKRGDFDKFSPALCPMERNYYLLLTSLWERHKLLDECTECERWIFIFSMKWIFLLSHSELCQLTRQFFFNIFIQGW